MFGLFKKKDLYNHVHAKRKVTISGVEFIIRKVDVSNYIEGAKVLKQTYDTYQPKKEVLPDQVSMKKVKEHMTDVICAGVVSPAIGRKEGEGVVQIADLFVDWDMANQLYESIFTFSYGKKKLKLSGSHASG